MDPAQRRQQDWKTMHQYSVLHAMDEEIECFFSGIANVILSTIRQVSQPTCFMAVEEPYTTRHYNHQSPYVIVLIFFENI